jgi:polyisoprenoid-binding protein YceI
MPSSSTLTVGPAQGDLLLRTTAEGKAAKMGHALTLRVRSWQCVAEVDGGTPLSADVTMDLASLEVVRGDGGVKPLSDSDKRKVLAGAAKALGAGTARFTSTSVEGSWRLVGQLALHGVTRPQVVDVTVVDEGSSVRIRGAAWVRQTDHGITPTSQLMGALQVGDVVQVLVEVVVPAPGQP